MPIQFHTLVKKKGKYHIVHAIWQGQRLGAFLDDIVFSHSHRCIHCTSATEPKVPNHC